MPPDQALPTNEVAALEHWIQEGAFWPRTATLSTPMVDPEVVKRHWAFQPMHEPVPPLPEDPPAAQTALDTFVLEKLTAQGLTPSPPADRRTLLRRLMFDLVGLAPTYEQVEEFERDPSPGAYARLVDRLLASPQYGERWGRLWLDIARYADTNPRRALGFEHVPEPVIGPPRALRGLVLRSRRHL